MPQLIGDVQDVQGRDGGQVDGEDGQPVGQRSGVARRTGAPPGRSIGFAKPTFSTLRAPASNGANP